MFQALRKRIHLSPATAIATLALVFAMTGGAYAAKRYLITSTGQISPGVLKTLKGRSGAVGARGPAGANGTNGAGGANGTNGAGGANGTNGAGGANGKSVVVTDGAHGCPAGGITVEVEGSGAKHEVCNGEEAEGGEFPSTLPEGKTETGSWASELTERAPSSENRSISFSVPLAAPLPEGHALFVSTTAQEGKVGAGAKEACQGKSGTALSACEERYKKDCTGQVEEPAASAGYLCVYQGGTENSEEGEFSVTSIGTPRERAGDEDAGRSGAVITIVYEGAEGEHAMRGSWAVTAP